MTCTNFEINCSPVTSAIKSILPTLRPKDRKELIIFDFNYAEVDPQSNTQGPVTSAIFFNVVVFPGPGDLQVGVAKWVLRRGRG